MSTTFPRQTEDTNRVRLTYLPEVTWGVYDTAADPKELRITGESFSLERGTIVSNELRRDRQVVDLIGTKITTEGGFEGEFSALTYDELIAGALLSTWTEVGSTPRGNTGVEVVVKPFLDTSGDQVLDRVQMEFKTPQNMARPTFNLMVGQVFSLESSNSGQGDRFEGYYQVIQHSADPSTAVTDEDGNALVDPQFYSRYVVRKVRRVNEVGFDENFPAPAAAGSEQEFYNDYQIIANEYAGPLDYALNSRAITNGERKCSFSVEKHFETTRDRIAYNGLIVATWNLNLDVEQIVSTGFTFMGRGGDVSEAVVDADDVRHFGQRLVGTPAPNELDSSNDPILGTQEQEFGETLNDQNAVQFGSVVEAPTSEILNGGRNISSIRLFRKNEDGTTGAPITGTEGLVMSLSLNADNGTRPKLALGDQNLIDVGIGQFSLTGSMTVYFSNAIMYGRFLADQAFALSFIIGDDQGNAYNVYCPNVKMLQGSPNAPTANEDVQFTTDIQALRDRLSGVREVTAGDQTNDVTGTGETIVISQIV